MNYFGIGMRYTDAVELDHWLRRRIRMECQWGRGKLTGGIYGDIWDALVMFTCDESKTLYRLPNEPMNRIAAIERRSRLSFCSVPMKEKEEYHLCYQG